MITGSRLYRTFSADGATMLDLLLSTFDALAEDLRLTAHAAATEDIASRCARSQHALLLLGHLESWIPDLSEQPVQESLTRFYGYLRLELLRLQAVPDEKAFLQLSAQVAEIRAAWQRRFWQAQPSPSAIPSEIHPRSESARVSWSA